jgi:hypothetical protein
MKKLKSGKVWVRIAIVLLLGPTLEDWTSRKARSESNQVDDRSYLARQFDGFFHFSLTTYSFLGHCALVLEVLEIRDLQ